MKTKVCYDVHYLIPRLNKNGYEFSHLDVYEDSEDWERDTKSYYFAKPEVKKLAYYYSFGTTASIYLSDGTKIRGLGNNVTTKEPHVKLHNNDYVSPRLVVSDNWVESTEDVMAWLLNHGITNAELEACKQEFTIYETIEYCGVCTPLKYDDSWAWSSETLILDEKEIETVLNDIEDELLREKIRCILYARVFKHRRY